MYKRYIAKVRYVLLFLVPLLAIVFLLNNSTSILKISYPIKYKDYVIKYSVQHKVDPYLVFAIIKAESGFNANATSHKSAKGLMQISDRTGNWGAKVLGIEQFNPHSLYDPETNIRIGCWYLNRLMKEFNNDVDLVIAAYNGGSGNVNEWLKDKNLSNTGESLERIPFKETDRFLKNVKNYYSVYKRLYEGKM